MMTNTAKVPHLFCEHGTPSIGCGRAEDFTGCWTDSRPHLMTNTTKVPRLAEIKKRLEATTQGAWSVAEDGRIFCEYGVPLINCGKEEDYTGCWRCWLGLRPHFKHLDDAIFCVFAKPDITWLLEQLEVLTELVDKYKSERDSLRRHLGWGSCHDKI